MKDDFYVGYLPTTSPGLRAFLRRWTVALLSLVVAASLGLTLSMGGFSSAAFEFGTVRDFEGTLAGGPVPMLLVDRPGQLEDSDGTSSYVLTAFGKFGAEQEVHDHLGQRVRLRGTLIYRDDRTMIELESGSIEVLATAGPGATGAAEELGTRTLAGEIVDSKCYLGVMKPGNLKPHRACAVRCISGGIPPVLLVRDEDGLASYYFLVSAEGGAVNDAVLAHVAEPVEVTGRVVRENGQHFLYADPGTYLYH